MALLLETLWGDLVIDLDEDASPELRSNFLKLAKARFFTNTLVFSVTPNRFCQLGDQVGDGSGGTSIHGLLDKTNDYRDSSRRFLASSCGRRVSQQELQVKGLAVATCLSVPDTIGSQFLITTASGPNKALDGFIQDESLFVVLGRVVEDDNDVLDKINAAFCDNKGRPYADIRLERALSVYDPYEDPPGLAQYIKANGIHLDDDGKAIRSPSPERPNEEVVSKRISAADVDAEDLENEEALQLRLQQEQEETEKRHDKSRAVVLEMLGDLPDADIRAPEDVLFLCKLNPVTVDEDLELIFSRFDESVKVEIIRDPDTGASLQYAFAEFSNKRAAEEAYFKMNNALIDDRRIKVDFSQSVAKLWDKYHQRARMPKPNRADGSFAKQLPPKDQKRRQDPKYQRSEYHNPEHHKHDFQQRSHPNDRRNRDDHPRRQDYAYSNDRREEEDRRLDRSLPRHSVRSERRPSHRDEEHYSRDEERRHRSDRREIEDRQRKRRRRDEYSDSSSSRSDISDRHSKRKSKKSDRKHKKHSKKKKKHRKHRRRESSSSRSQSR